MFLTCINVTTAVLGTYHVKNMYYICYLTTVTNNNYYYALETTWSSL
jgi:hypothetical protein